MGLQRKMHCESMYHIEASLIPGLPDDVAMLCLLRVPRIYHASMNSVSKRWNKLLHSKDFFRERKKLGFADAWLMVMLMDIVNNGHYTCCIYDLATKNILCRSAIPVPEGWSLTKGSGSFKIAAVDTSLVMVESKTNFFRMVLENQTRIYDTVEHKWRLAARLNVPRCQFFMGAIDGVLYVAGGYNHLGDLETATEAYDLNKDEWKQVSRMPFGLERVDCEVVFGGKLYVRGFSAGTQACVVLAYDPLKDVWEEEKKMSSMDHGELVATSHGIYNLTISDCFFKYDMKARHWLQVGSGDKCSAPAFNVHAQRAFGLGNEIFLLTGEMAGASYAIGHDGVICHSLFLGNSWFRAGAIVWG